MVELNGVVAGGHHEPVRGGGSDIGNGHVNGAAGLGPVAEHREAREDGRSKGTDHVILGILIEPCTIDHDGVAGNDVPTVYANEGDLLGCLDVPLPADLT